MRSRVGSATATVLIHALVIGLALVRFPSSQDDRLPETINVRITASAKAEEPLPIEPVEKLTMPVAAPARQPEFLIATEPSVIGVTEAKRPISTLPEYLATSAPGQRSAGPETWQRQVLARLEKSKRYPRGALFSRQQGVALVRFTIDREGSVLDAKLEKRSGFSALDQETLALVRRAQPLPKAPPDIPGMTIELVVPIEFFIP